MQTILRLLNQFSDIDIVAFLLFESIDHFLSFDAPNFGSMHETLKHIVGNQMFREAFAVSLAEHLVTSLLAL
jgi:hypothetical protein